MMKILGLSDLHTEGEIPKKALQKIIVEEKIDVIILAGDLTTYGSSKLVEKILQEFTSFEKTILYIPGNMDSPDSGDHQFNNVIPLHARSETIKGITFLGLGASNPTPFHTPYTLKEEELNDFLIKAARELPQEKPLFLVSHSPPLNSDADIVHNGKHVGSSAVRVFIDNYQPLGVLCGHIHESPTICKVGETCCINPGPARHNKGAIIEITKKDDQYFIEAKLVSF